MENLFVFYAAVTVIMVCFVVGKYLILLKQQKCLHSYVHCRVCEDCGIKEKLVEEDAEQTAVLQPDIEQAGEIIKSCEVIKERTVFGENILSGS